MGLIRDSRGVKSGNRVVGDRRRHREKVREAIKKGLPDAIAEQPLIGKSGKKIIKVPIRGLKEWRFVYGTNTPRAGQGSGKEKKGQVIFDPSGKSTGPYGGNEPGEDVYETEVTLDEAIDLMFEDLQLPRLEQKKLRHLEVEARKKPRGYRRRGPRSQFSANKTLLKRKRREMAVRGSRAQILTPKEYESLPENEKQDYILWREDNLYHFRVPLAKEDLRFKRHRPDMQKQSNAVVICIMDTSSSMGTMKKYLARSFFLLLYLFVRTRYKHVDVVFVAHDVRAKEVTEDEFFHKGESGGTCISSGYEKALEIIRTRYNPEAWNIYPFHCSDGDNFEYDNEKAFARALELCAVSNLFGYGEIKPEGDQFAYVDFSSGMLDGFEKRIASKVSNFATVRITNKEDVWPAFKNLLKHEYRKEKSDG